MSSWGKEDKQSDKPKYLSVTDPNNNKWNTYSVSVNEMTVARANANASYHPQHAGWVKVIPTYTDAQGNIRRKSEVLVVQSSAAGGNANTNVGVGLITNANAYVIGTGTTFTTDLLPGDIITVGGANVFSVVTVQNNTFANLNAGPVTYTTNTWIYVRNSDADNQLTGTFAVAAGNAALFGYGTEFTTELKVGDLFYTSNGNVKSVSAIVNSRYVIANSNFVTFSANGATANVWDNLYFPKR